MKKILLAVAAVVVLGLTGAWWYYSRPDVIEFAEHGIRVECPTGSRVTTWDALPSNQFPNVSKVAERECRDRSGVPRSDTFGLNVETEKLLYVNFVQRSDGTSGREYYAKPTMASRVDVYPPELIRLCGDRYVETGKGHRQGHREVHKYSCEGEPQAALICPVGYSIYTVHAWSHTIKCVNQNGMDMGKYRHFTRTEKETQWTETDGLGNKIGH